ncbi:MAG: hypothetical protein K2W82_17085 [Candidatus Obscuribacterales bacterium]|nr:hypothetical protein [Candidatus Obscuribacterales bacterium]
MFNKAFVITAAILAVLVSDSLSAIRVSDAVQVNKEELTKQRQSDLTMQLELLKQVAKLSATGDENVSVCIKKASNELQACAAELHPKDSMPVNYDKALAHLFLGSQDVIIGLELINEEKK